MSKDKAQKRPHITLLIGNPGTGKSALLNSLTRGANFRSGISLGRGVTHVLQIHKKTETEWFADTPGLDDVEIRKQAAAEIEEALKQGAEYTICFVVTLESGRLRPSDLTTIQIVMESIELPNGAAVKYGIIVNKLEREVYELFQDPDNVSLICGQLSLNAAKGGCFTNSIFPVMFDPKLQAKTNVVADKNEELEEFLRLLPRNVIEVENVQKIKYDEIENLRKLYDEMTDRLLKDNEFLKERLVAFTESTKKYESQLTDLERENQKLSQELNNLKSESTKNESSSSCTVM